MEPSSEITSTRNQHVSYVKSLRNPRSRREAGTYLIEGVRLAREALNAGVRPELVLYDPEGLGTSGGSQDLMARVGDLDNAHAATPAVLAAASETRNSQGIVIVAKEPASPALEEIAAVPFLLILDGISDPGNAGAILRSAAAAGLSHVVFAGNTVDPYAGKVVRAGMGAHFRLRLVRAPWDQLEVQGSRFKVQGSTIEVQRSTVNVQGATSGIQSTRPGLSRARLGAFQIVAAEAGAPTTIYDVDWSRPTALIIGSEAHGLTPGARRAVSLSARIPMALGVESLNAAAVAAIILFHARREQLSRVEPSRRE
jgi:RNA methyltransferase, TrmH family